jgi:hypothetical protein
MAYPSIGRLRHITAMRSSRSAAKLTQTGSLVLTECRLTREQFAELKMRRNSVRKLEGAP